MRKHQIGSVLLLASCALDAPATSTSTDDIINGSTDPNHRSVAMIYPVNEPPSDPYIHCTATMLGKQTFLTAAHCVTDPGTGALLSRQYVYLETEECEPGGGGTTVCYPTWDTYTGTAVRHPSFSMSGPLPWPNDVAIVTLDAAIVGGHFDGKGKIATSPPAVNENFLLVGFGVPTAATDPYTYSYTTRRVGSNSVDSVDATSIYFTGTTGTQSSTCFGDSGGPMFFGGVTSECIGGITQGQEGTTGYCTDNGYPFVDTRIDIYASWILANATEPLTTCTP